jgi:hypothetical protein
VIRAAWSQRIERPVEEVFESLGFAAAGDGATDVSCTVELTMKGPTRLFEPLLRRTIRRQIESSRGPLLKKALEGR